MQRAGRINSSVVRIVILISTLLLGACFESTEPLLRPSDIVTPLPRKFTIVQIENGDIKFKDTGEPVQLKILNLSGSAYLEEGSGYSYQLGKLGDEYTKRRMFLLQAREAIIHYEVATITDSGLVLFVPSLAYDKEGRDSALATALRSAGVKFVADKEKRPTFKFSDPDQLLAAGRALADNMNLAAGVATYRIVDSAKPDEVARLNAEIAQAQAKAKIKAEPKQAQVNVEPKIEFTGYSHARLFEGIYRGDADPRGLTDLDFIFLQEFLQDFVKSSDCNHLVPNATFLQITAKATGPTIHNQLTDLLKPRPPTRGPIDYERLFREGMESGTKPIIEGSREIANADSDAHRFGKQYGCTTLVAYRFFDNMTKFVNRL